MAMKSASMSRWGVSPVLLTLSNLVFAAGPQPWQLNMTEGATEISHEVYRMHMMVFLVCCAIGVVVFGAMIYVMFKFRKSKGAVPATWSHNTKAEIIWTITPIVILVAMALPATNVLVNMAYTNDSPMTIKVTGYQWKWRYDYVDYNGANPGIHFLSKLDGLSDRTRQLGSGLDPAKVMTGDENTYLLNVDKPLVVPTDVKIRFVVTADDVIHSWWVPALGWKSDAIPGIINDAWTNIHEPGIYRGQCAELCGQDHGFMPIVVKAVPKAEFDKWLAEQQAADKAAPAAPADAVAGTPDNGGHG